MILYQSCSFYTLVSLIYSIYSLHNGIRAMITLSRYIDQKNKSEIQWYMNLDRIMPKGQTTSVLKVKQT